MGGKLDGEDVRSQDGGRPSLSRNMPRRTKSAALHRVHVRGAPRSDFELDSVPDELMVSGEARAVLQGFRTHSSPFVLFVGDSIAEELALYLKRQLGFDEVLCCTRRGAMPNDIHRELNHLLSVPDNRVTFTNAGLLIVCVGTNLACSSPMQIADEVHRHVLKPLQDLCTCRKIIIGPCTRESLAAGDVYNFESSRSERSGGASSMILHQANLELKQRSLDVGFEFVNLFGGRLLIDDFRDNLHLKDEGYLKMLSAVLEVFVSESRAPGGAHNVVAASSAASTSTATRHTQDGRAPRPVHGVPSHPSRAAPPYLEDLIKNRDREVDKTRRGELAGVRSSPSSARAPPMTPAGPDNIRELIDSSNAKRANTLRAQGEVESDLRKKMATGINPNPWLMAMYNVKGRGSAGEGSSSGDGASGSAQGEGGVGGNSGEGGGGDAETTAASAAAGDDVASTELVAAETAAETATETAAEPAAAGDHVASAKHGAAEIAAETASETAATADLTAAVSASAFSVAVASFGGGGGRGRASGRAGGGRGGRGGRGLVTAPTTGSASSLVPLGKRPPLSDPPGSKAKQARREPIRTTTWALILLSNDNAHEKLNVDLNKV